MNFIEHAGAKIFFGDKATCIEPDTIRYQYVNWENLPVQTVIFQHQVHAAQGHAVTLENLEQMSQLETYDGDYLVTQLPEIGLGVLTADCLPIALFDAQHGAIAMVHAGWRGSACNIVAHAVECMTKLYATQPEKLCAWLGPCARACCYRVDEAFVAQLPAWARTFVSRKKEQICFDLCACNQAEFARIGVEQKNINISACACTMCHENFCSYRRDSGSSARQMSIIWLK